MGVSQVIQQIAMRIPIQHTVDLGFLSTVIIVILDLMINLYGMKIHAYQKSVTQRTVLIVGTPARTPFNTIRFTNIRKPKMKNCDDSNLDRITDIIKDLEDKKWETPWDLLETIELEIRKYQDKLLAGEYYEPRF